jgi:hypothetical protein
LAVGDDSTIRTSSVSNRRFLGKLASNMVSIVLIDTGSEQQILLLFDSGSVVYVLAWIGCLIFEDLDKLVKPGRNNGAEYRSKPINPVIGGELKVNNSRTERTCGV